MWILLYLCWEFHFSDKMEFTKVTLSRKGVLLLRYHHRFFETISRKVDHSILRGMINTNGYVILQEKFSSLFFCKPFSLAVVRKKQFGLLWALMI